MLWALPGIGDLQALGPHAFHIAAGFMLAVLLIVSGLLFGPDAAPGEIDLVSSGALAAYLFAAMLLVLATGQDTLALTLFVRTRHRDDGHSLAERRRHRRRSGRRHPRHA